jgi:hypothetical protein
MPPPDGCQCKVSFIWWVILRPYRPKVPRYEFSELTRLIVRLMGTLVAKITPRISPFPVKVRTDGSDYADGCVPLT